MKSKIEERYIKHNGDRVCQGDILRDFVYEVVSVSEGKAKARDITYPYVVVLTQDCDLELDYNNRVKPKDDQDKYLHRILLCPAYLAESLKSGEHLTELGLVMQRIGRQKWGDVETNQNQRYHFLYSYREYQIPDLVIDFKHFFTVARDTLYGQGGKLYIGSLNELFRESLSQRFAYYLSRIGLPELYEENVEEEVITKLRE